jgi:hypothetical protein
VLWDERSSEIGDVRNGTPYITVKVIYEIVGMPEAPDEDLGDILQKLFDDVGCLSTVVAVSNAYRKGTTKHGLPGTIAATFHKASDKTRFIKATRTKKLSSTIICPENPRPVYINESLTKHSRYLLFGPKKSA